MKNYSIEDLEALTRGQSVPSDVFQAILADPEAFNVLTRRLQVRDLLQPSPDEPEPQDVPAMDVTFEELALFTAGRLEDEARKAAVHRFLSEHFPEALPDPHGEAGTEIDLLSSGDTDIELNEPK